MTPNVVSRARLRAGTVECPLCGRQIARPTERLLHYGPVETTVDNADVIVCPACDGVTFIEEGPPE